MISVLCTLHISPNRHSFKYNNIIPSLNCIPLPALLEPLMQATHAHCRWYETSEDNNNASEEKTLE